MKGSSGFVGNIIMVLNSIHPAERKKNMLVERNKSYAFTSNANARAVQRLQQIETVSVSTTPPVTPPRVMLRISDQRLAEAGTQEERIVVQVAKIDLSDEASLANHFAEFAEE